MLSPHSAKGSKTIWGPFILLFNFLLPQCNDWITMEMCKCRFCILDLSPGHQKVIMQKRLVQLPPPRQFCVRNQMNVFPSEAPSFLRSLADDHKIQFLLLPPCKELFLLSSKGRKGWRWRGQHLCLGLIWDLNYAIWCCSCCSDNGS